MRIRAIIFAAALVMAPLGARGADLVVWWQEGYHPQEDAALREVVAAFEQETGKQVELVFYSWRRCRIRSRRRSRRAAARLRVRVLGLRPHRRMGLRRSVSGSVGRDRPLFGPVRSGELDRATLLNATTGQKAIYGLPMGQRPTSPTSGRASWSRPVSRSRIFPEVGSVLVVLVRRGAARSTPGHRPGRHLGGGASDVRRSG